MARKTIGENPLDTVITPLEPKNAKEEPLLPNRKLPPSPAINRIAKQRITVQISEQIVERAKNAVYWTRGLTLAQFVEQSIESALMSLEGEAIIFDDKSGEPLKQKGEPFPERSEELKSGRPVK